MDIFIIGDARSGKSTAAQFLSEALGCDYAETGQVVIGELAKLYSEEPGSPHGFQRWCRMITMAKHEYRKELNVIGDLMTRLSPTCLIEECRKRTGIIVGVRRQREVLGYLQTHPGARSVWIKVIAGSPPWNNSRYELSAQPCEYEVINDGDRTELQRKVCCIADKIKANLRVINVIEHSKFR